MPATNLVKDEDFANFLNAASNKLIILDFYADWCAPCKKIAPFIDELADNYQEKIAVAKINTQEHTLLADSFKVESIPYFVFMRNGQVVDSVTGGSQKKRDVLADKIKSFVEQMETEDEIFTPTVPQTRTQNIDTALLAATQKALFGVAKAIDLIDQIDKSNSECLNQDEEHPWTNAVFDSGMHSCLKSDCDEQLLLRITFKSKVKLYGIKLLSKNVNYTRRDERGRTTALDHRSSTEASRQKSSINQSCSTSIPAMPNKIRLFINQTNSLDFDKAETGKSTLDCEINQEDGSEVSDAILLPKMKFSNVENLTIFISGIHGGGDVCEIRGIVFLGDTHGERTNMSEFKRVQGKVGEGE